MLTDSIKFRLLGATVMFVHEIIRIMKLPLLCNTVASFTTKLFYKEENNRGDLVLFICQN